MGIPTLLRHVAGTVYHRLAGVAGNRALRRALAQGLSPEIVPALRFLFAGELPESAVKASSRVEALRRSIAARPDRFQFAFRESPLGVVRWPEPAPTGASGPGILLAGELANRLSVSRRWGLFLYLLAEGLDADTILETGACVGISGAYLASAPCVRRFVTVEGSAALAAITRDTLASVSDVATVIGEPFETGIDSALSMLDGEHRRVDLAYIDGHHDREATLRYVRQLLPHLSGKAFVVLDDIHLYEEMWSAWQSIVQTYGFEVAVNAGRFGVLVWKGGSTSATAQYDVARYTGRWRVGPSRQRSLPRPV